MLRHRVELALVLGVVGLARLLPLPALRLLGAGCGRLAFALDRRHRHVVLSNLAGAFPERAGSERLAIGRDCFAFFGSYLFELLAGLRGVSAERLAGHEHLGREHAEAALAEGRGVLFFTGHYGGWELMALAFGALSRPVSLVARRLDNPHLEGMLTRLRTSTGNAVIEKRDGLRPTLRALRAGGAVALLIDQNVAGDERVFVDFFGRPAATTPALALLHLRTGAPLLPVFSTPLPDGRWRFVYGPRVQVELTGDRRQDVVRVTQACTQVLEEQIRREPRYWLWMHRRWKTQLGSAGAEDAARVQPA